MTPDTAQRLSWDQISHGADHYKRGMLLWEHRRELSDEDYWPAVAAGWQDNDLQPLTRADWHELWQMPSRQHNRHNVMTPEELEKLAAPPDRVTVHRGYRYRIEGNYAHGTFSNGLSWTTNPQKAGIIAVFDARNESEIVVEPRYVYSRSSTIVVAPTSSEKSDQAEAA